MDKAGPSTIFGVHVKLIRRNVVPTLALAKSPTVPSNEMAWLGAGLLIAADKPSGSRAATLYRR
jgi:hypothetical protein